ncbi:uncharacterized protein LOC126816062 isoform X1 [Patella vulgata]|uniref:uncharacterized protein LOC126816062 isoform X1 n=1 Tax=Patella vulgata TaxID=6465 RepID=UPI00217F6B29|nr:uncharacterized protein LOC126816062 isoform X1 [Patella vulgata]
MNSSAAENFINSLVRNLQVLCHSNVEFDDDIEVVGHLYLKVDKAKKFNYIVDEKVCKNDASSTVFVSNSYHSCNQNKTNDTDSDIHKPNQDTISSPRDTSNGGSSKRDANKSLIHFSNSFTNDEPPSKSQRLNVSLSSQDVNKSFKPRIKHTFNRNTTQIPPKLKTEEPDHIDLTKIKSEPPDDVTENLNCYFESPGKSHNSSENESRANITDTGQLNDDEFFANIKEKAFGIHPVALIPNELSQSGHESLSHYSQASTSASNFNLHNPDLSQSSEVYAYPYSSSAYQVLNMLEAAGTSPKPTLKDLAERFQMDEYTVVDYLNQKDKIKSYFSNRRFKTSVSIPSRRLTLAEKVQLIQTAESSNKPSQCILAKQFGISQPTACRILYQKDKILEEYRLSKQSASDTDIQK